MWGASYSQGKISLISNLWSGRCLVDVKLEQRDLGFAQKCLHQASDVRWVNFLLRCCRQERTSACRPRAPPPGLLEHCFLCWTGSLLCSSQRRTFFCLYTDSFFALLCYGLVLLALLYWPPFLFQISHNFFLKFILNLHIGFVTSSSLPPPINKMIDNLSSLW